ncbi:kyphoscoliosis peptidase-like [Rhinophrynus dorsalis]
MCREIGIRCKEIAGYSRGMEYSEGHSFQRTKSNHMWNAVELDNHWYLLDACWGAGTVDLQKRTFIPSYDDFFFLTDPEDFIETHWPGDLSWQLLEPAVSFEDFEQKIFKTSEFFRLHLSIISPNVFSLKTEHGEVKVSLGSSYPTEFSYKIYKLDNNERSFVEKVHGIMSMDDSTMTLRVIPPTSGLFELMIFARPSESKQLYRWVCSYQIDCPEPKGLDGLPINPFHFWGLHQRARDFGVVSYNFGGDLIIAETSYLVVTFKTSRSLLATYELVHKDLTEPLSKKCFASHIEETKLGCHAIFPFHGYYRLSLFVKDIDGDQFKNAANLLIQCTNPINHNELFPLNLSVHCGPGISSKFHGLTDPSHTSPVISTTSGKCNITFHTLPDVEVFAVLENNKVRNELYSLDRYCLITHLDYKITISVHLPERGNYKLSIFARNQESQDFSHALDYVIRCFSDNPLLPFPKVYSAWRQGCTLLQPRSGLLTAESWVIFRVRIPGALKVVVIGPVKTELELSKNKIWEGRIFTGSAGSLIKVAVKFTQNSTTMDILMSFKVQTNLNTIHGSSG